MRTYERAASVVFLKTKEEFGGLSNMAGGFPLKVNGLRIFTSEALYQACRFPHRPELQRLIVGQSSPMTAKMKGKPYRSDSRPDWDRVRVKIMRWCLRVKLAQNWALFNGLLLRTGNRPIVEQSRNDDFWGAKELEDGTLVGQNVLGRLLMELREAVRTESKERLLRVEPLSIPDFLLDGRPIGAVCAEGGQKRLHLSQPEECDAASEEPNAGVNQRSLFDESAVKDASPQYLATPVGATGVALVDLKRYPTMKYCGVPWLGKVPEHWAVKPNRALFEEVKNQNHPDEPLLSVTISKGVIRQSDLLSDTSKKDSSNLDKSKYKLVQPGEIAYNKMRAWQGAVGLSRYRGIVSPAYIVQRPRTEVLPEYMHYLLRTPQFAKEAERWSYGISSDQWSLRPEHFKMIYGCLPPLTEQTAIVWFLDHADRRIRRYIRAKQKLIKLLEEQKQAIIHRAVTRGLDPNVRLKPSGVAWLGEVPERWEVLPLRRRWSVTDCKHLTVPFVDNVDGIPLASVREVQSFELSLANAKRTTVDSFKSLIEGGRQPRKGDLIYCRNVSVGAAAIVNTDDRLAMGQDVCLIRSSAESQRYLNYFLRSPAMQRQLALLLVGSTFNRINVADIKALVTVVPPRREQDSIVDFLDAELAETSRGQTLAANEISLLREYRTRVIVDVVTGKLDVREAAAQLPDEVEELESSDETDALSDSGEEIIEDFDASPEESEA